ncbi:hypothetical protein QVD17_19403 [Tagetes erecta]|uniref:Uncharacterized protein n=1 Tax=Tagetes erecta TaxID=13708 RepID=A0AAD8KMZ3_TARER|nr:hypothetical protein QVD17_19403 [Tagetes erecta]
MFPEKNGGNAAVLAEIGTHGTMGNLLMKEIEHYKRLESEICGDHLNSKSTSNPEKHTGNDRGGGSRFWCGLGFFKAKWQSKKSNGGTSDKFLPRICMMMNVAEDRHNYHQHRHANKIPGFNYHNLEADTKQHKICKAIDGIGKGGMLPLSQGTEWLLLETRVGCRRSAPKQAVQCSKNRTKCMQT